MAFTLCEECFPGVDLVEAYTMVPLTGCAKCGAHDRRAEGVRVRLLPRWPQDVMPNWVHDQYVPT